MEAEGSWSEFEENDDIFEGFLFGVSQLSVTLAVIHDVIICFKWSIATWACNWFVGKESLSIPASGDMIGYEFDYTCIYSIKTLDLKKEYAFQPEAYIKHSSCKESG